jgi:hypothetical protein
MCLSVVYRGKKKKRVLSELKDEFYCYKVVSCSLKSPCMGISVLPGRNVAKILKDFDGRPITSGMGYRLGFHAFLNRKDASVFCMRAEVILKIKVKKSDVLAIGKNSSHDDGDTVVLKEIYYPKTLKRIVREKMNGKH